MRLYLPENCKSKRVCVALSGGGDSVALLYALKEKAGEWNMPLSAVNVEHGIRGESSLADTEFVKKLCGKENIPLYCYSEDVPRLAEEWGMSAEAAARAVRYRIFLDILRQDKADCIATAHHAGDNAESVLFNLFRGSALTGAALDRMRFFTVFSPGTNGFLPFYSGRFPPFQAACRVFFARARKTRARPQRARPDPRRWRARP